MISMDPIFNTGGFVPFAPFAQPGSGMTLQPIADPNVARPRTPIGDLVRNKNPIGNLLNPPAAQPQMPMGPGFSLLGPELTPSTPTVGIGQIGADVQRTEPEYANWNPNWNEPFGKTLVDLASGSVPITIGRGVVSEVSGGRVTPPPGYQGIFDLAGDLMGGSAFGKPASMTVSRGEQGPQMPAVPLGPPVEISLLGDPGAGGYSGFSPSDASYGGISFGDLSDMGYSGGFGVF